MIHKYILLVKTEILMSPSRKDHAACLLNILLGLTSKYSVLCMHLEHNIILHFV